VYECNCLVQFLETTLVRGRKYSADTRHCLPLPCRRHVQSLC